MHLARGGYIIEQIDAGLVVAPHVAWGLGHAFGKVEAVAVDGIHQPNISRRVSKYFVVGLSWFQSKNHVSGLGETSLKSRVVRSRLEGRSIPVHLQKRIRVIGMVEHHIE